MADLDKYSHDKYLRYYKTDEEYSEERVGKYWEPWVSFTVETSGVSFNKTEEEKLIETPLTFECVSAGTFYFLDDFSWGEEQDCWIDEDTGEEICDWTGNYIITHANNFYYRINDGEWINVKNFNEGDYIEYDEETGEVISPTPVQYSIGLTPGDKIQFKTSGETIMTNVISYQQEETNIMVEVKGNLLSCYDGENFATITEVPSASTSYQFANSFFMRRSDIVSAEKLILPVYEPRLTSMYSGPLAYLFSGCENLKTPPKLRNTVLSRGMYRGMFSGCKNLLSIPTMGEVDIFSGESCFAMFSGCTSLSSLNGISIGKSTSIVGARAMEKMFRDCTNITTPPELPAMNVGDYAYYDMFFGSGLLYTPALPATGLGTYCYYEMFYNCHSLTAATELPAQTSEQCYRLMFANCENLVVSPPTLGISNEELSRYCFCGMFSGCTSLTDAPEILAASFSGSNCCDSMFVGCTNLTGIQHTLGTTSGSYGGLSLSNMFAGCTKITVAPTLPGQYFGSSSCYRMFFGCTSLTTTQSVLAESCATAYSSAMSHMFNGCSNLVNGPTLIGSSALTAGDWCFQQMFYGCEKLSTLPSILFSSVGKSGLCRTFMNATSLTNPNASQIGVSGASIASGGCVEMFLNCSSLDIAPELPATNLSGGCYRYMFHKCSNLLSGPSILPATSYYGCYGMFSGCTSLQSGPDLPAQTLQESCYNGMFGGCASLTTAPTMSATVASKSCCRYMFYNCESLVTAPELTITGTLPTEAYWYMFRGCKNLHYLKCLATDLDSTFQSGVYGILDGAGTEEPAGGTLVKSSSSRINWTTFIPSNWTIQNNV